MAFCAPPQLIPSDPPIFVTDDPGFESLVSSNMPDPTDLLDGLDALLNSPIGAIDDDLASLDTLDVLLAAATFTPGNWAAANVAPLLALYSTLGISGDALLAVLLGAIANTPAIPGVPPVPPDPGLDLETLCNECNEGEPSEVDINITELPGGENWPQPGTPGGGDCLNPQPSGGYAPGPCPSQQSPAPPPPPEPPPPEPPPAPDPPPDNPPDQGGDSGYGGGGSGDDGSDAGAGELGGDFGT